MYVGEKARLSDRNHHDSNRDRDYQSRIYSVCRSVRPVNHTLKETPLLSPATKIPMRIGNRSREVKIGSVLEK